MIASDELHKNLTQLLDEVERQNVNMCPADREDILSALAELWTAAESLNTQMKALVAQEPRLDRPTPRLRLVK